MRQHIEYSESRSWFNNNQSHYFKQFLQVCHRLDGRVVPQGSIFYVPLIITCIMQYSQTCKLLPVFLFIYQFTPLPADKNFCSFVSVSLHTNLFLLPYGFFPCFLPWLFHSNDTVLLNLVSPNMTSSRK